MQWERYNNNMKKILFYTNIPSPYRVDFFNELGKYCELTVLFESTHSTERDELWKQYHFDNFKGIIMHGKRTAVDMAFCPEIIRHLRAKKYDEIVITIMASLTSVLAVNWLRLHHISYIYEGDGGFVHSENQLKYLLKKNVISHAKYCFSTSAAFDGYCKNYEARQEKIYRYPFTSIWEKDLLEKPLSVTDKQTLRVQYGIQEDHMLISVGQMIHRKGFDILLRAAEVLDKSWGIYLVGGQPSDELRDLVEQLSIENVHFVDFMPKEKLWKYYQAADFFVLPTRDDPWGLVVNEAMANALPVITTTRCIAGLEMVEDGVNGFLYEPEDVDQLKELLTEISNSLLNLEKMADAALKTARKYTIEEMVQAHCRCMDI